MNRTTLALLVALTLGGGIVAQASTIYGTFSIGGSMTVTENTIDWVDFSNVPLQYVIGPPGPTGAFSAVALNSEGAIQDLTLTNEPVGMTFDDPDWLTLPSPDGNLSITLTYIYAGSYGDAECTDAAAPNQQCTPLDAAGTPGPFNLQNSQSGTTSSASFEFAGIVTDGNPADANPITGQFSVNFNTPYQTVLTELATGPDFSVTNTYSATFTSTPEPGAGSMLGIGALLIGISLFAKKKFAKA